ncbi:unnamed protein product [Sympodiomycopsis kandeliae]
MVLFESLISPIGYSTSTCGYCRPPSTRQDKNNPPPKTSHSFGFWAHSLSAEHYQQLIDRGWRRSGCYVYRPDLYRTCCKQISIRLETGQYKLSKSARKCLRKVIQEELSSSQAVQEPTRWGKGKGKGKYGQPVSLEDYFDVIQGHQQHQCDSHAGPSSSHTERWRAAQAHRKDRNANNPLLAPPGPALTHHLKVKLVTAEATATKYSLFRKYQMQIHGESEDQVSDRKGFSRFLCESPIEEGPLGTRREANQYIDLSADQVDIPYGLYHLEWYLHSNDTQVEQMIGVSVLDILPESLSSVYYFYDPAYEKRFQLGKLSALREILLVKELQRKCPTRLSNLKYYALGYYVHSCQKMKYKIRYAPSQLLDFSTGQYHDSQKVLKLLDQGQACDFDNVSQTNSSLDTSSPPNEADPEDEDSDSTSSSSDISTDLPLDPFPPGTLLNPADINLSRVLILDQENQSEGIQYFLSSSLYLLSSLQDNEEEEVKEAKKRVERLRQCIAALGWDVSTKVVFFV